MSNTAIKVEDLSKIYRLGEIGTGTISRDMERWFKTKVLKHEDPFLKIGEINDRANKGASNIVYSLRDINFEIQKGDAIGIIGRNGAGKSTLLKILSRVTTPTAGKINIKGRVASLLEVGTGFHPELTGRENIYLNGAILGMRKREIDMKLDEIIDFSGVERYIDTPVKRYSSGMYVRLAFAVAAHLESEILIVDEVLAVGDAEFQKKCLGKMGDVSRGEGRTVLFVSHNLSAIKLFCDKAILMNEGKVSSFSKTIDVIRSYNQLFSQVNRGINGQKGYFYFGDKSHGIISASIFVNDEQSNMLVTGSVVIVKLNFISDRHMYAGEIGFGFSNADMLDYLRLNNKHLGQELAIQKGSGNAEIIIRNFPIYMNGQIFLNLYFGDENGDYEILENVVVLQVTTNNPEKNYRELNEKHNLFVFQGIEFCVEKS